MSTVTINVPGIHCDNCKSSIEGALSGLDGVNRAEVSVDDHKVQVEFDESRVSLGDLQEAIVEQGYDVPA